MEGRRHPASRHRLSRQRPGTADAVPDCFLGQELSLLVLIAPFTPAGKNPPLVVLAGVR